MPIERVLADFEGVWQIEREIIPAEGPRAIFEGRAVWTRGTIECDYVETGTLRMPATSPMHAERRYVWRDDLSVFFSDGRFFHAVPPSGGGATHFCDPDTYVVAYDFADWPVFRVRWTVRGPRKAYVSNSVYTRVSG